MEMLRNPFHVFIRTLVSRADAVHPEHVGTDLHHTLAGYGCAAVGGMRNLRRKENVKVVRAFEADAVPSGITERPVVQCVREPRDVKGKGCAVIGGLFQFPGKVFKMPAKTQNGNILRVSRKVLGKFDRILKCINVVQEFPLLKIEPVAVFHLVKLTVYLGTL